MDANKAVMLGNRVEKKRAPVIDRGWSWMIVLATSIINVLLSMQYCSGVFNVIFLEVFRKDKQTTTWLVSVQVSLLSLLGPVAAQSNQIIGPRYTALIGSFMGSLGFFLAFLSTEYIHIILTFSILVGSGNAFLHLPSCVSIGVYFKRYRNLAFGIASSVTGLGTMVLPPIISYCKDTFGWRGCMLIMSGIYMHSLVACALIRPQEPTSEQETDAKTVKKDTHLRLPARPNPFTASLLSVASMASGSNFKRQYRSELEADHRVVQSSLLDIRPRASSFSTRGRHQYQCQYYSHGDLRRDKLINNQYKGTEDDKISPVIIQKGIPTIVRNHFIELEDEMKIKNNLWESHVHNDSTGTVIHEERHPILTVIINPKLAILNFHLLLTNASSFIVYVHFPDYFYNQGMTGAEMTMLMTILGMCSISCRLLAGVLTNDKEFSVLLIYFSGVGLASVFIILCPVLVSSPTGRVVFVLGVGFYGNTYNSLMAPLTLSLCSLEELSMAYGIGLFTCGISGLLGPPFAGWLYDVTGSYAHTFVVAGTMYGAGSLLLMFIPIIGYYDPVNEQTDAKQGGHVMEQDPAPTKDAREQDQAASKQGTEHITEQEQ